jgi:muramoyltetrapeptide carboxypeptidase
MAVWIDTPRWPAHGRLWSHLVSDTSYDELHAFAAANGIPRRGFERDHYDVPAEAVDRLVAAGAHPTTSRDLVARLISAGLRRRKADAMALRMPGRALLRPRRLRPGDLIGVMAPAGPITPERLERGVARLTEWGLRVRVAPHTLGRHRTLPYLAADDEARAVDFTDLWLDDEVAAVIAGRGGYGTQRMLDLLDWRRLAEARPKILAGFSDVTALHQALASRLGLVSLHSHVVTSLGGATAESADWMRRMLFEPAAVDLLAGSPVRVGVPGSAHGVLTGGNLTLLAAEIGSELSRGARAGIVFLEEVTEEPYRIDRSLTQLLRSGWFEGARGLLIGTFVDRGDLAEVEAMLLDRLCGLGIPMVLDFDAGHTASARSIPLGVPATLDVPADDRAPALRLDMPPFT